MQTEFTCEHSNQLFILLGAVAAAEVHEGDDEEVALRVAQAYCHLDQFLQRYGWDSGCFLDQLDGAVACMMAPGFAGFSPRSNTATPEVA